jgi:hypothetical protein
MIGVRELHQVGDFTFDEKSIGVDLIETDDEDFLEARVCAFEVVALDDEAGSTSRPSA